MSSTKGASNRLAGWRVALRLARREALRRKAQTALMLVLIVLPVLAVSAAAVVWRTQDVSGVEGLDRRLGAAQALVTPERSGPVAQHFDPQVALSWGGLEGQVRAGSAEIGAVLGAERPMIPIRQHTLLFETDEGIAELETLETALADPLAEGLVRLTEGRLPTRQDEVVVNAALVERGPGIGETLTLLSRSADGEERRVADIVGIAEHAAYRDYPVAAGLPEAFGPYSEDAAPQWLVGGAPVDWAAVQALNEIGAFALSRAVLSDPPPSSALPPEVEVMVDGGPDEATITVLGLIIVMVLIEVVLLAGPAFAVRAKAQAHTLALVAATGGTPAQARRTVLASGVVVGIVGGVLGAVGGIGVGALAVPLAQRMQRTWFGPFEVPWPLLAVVAGFGFLSAFLAAVVPAVSASRQDVVAVLAGRRGEGRPSARSPLLGVVLIGLGVAGSLLGVADGGASPLLVGGSAILAVLGMVLLVPVAVAAVARVATRWPLPLRFAARDAARHRTRTVPAVAAVGATVAGVIALGIGIGSMESADEQAYRPQLAMGYGAVTVATVDAEAEGVDVAAIRGVLEAEAGKGSVTEVTGVVTDGGDDEGDAGGWRELTFTTGGEDVEFSSWGTLGSSYLVGAEVPEGIGLSPAERTLAEERLAAGEVVVLRTSDFVGPDDFAEMTVEVTFYDGAGESRPLRSLDVATSVLDPDSGTAAVAALLPQAVVDELELSTATSGLITRPGLSDEAVEDLNERLQTMPGAGYLYVERGYRTEASVRIVQLVLAILGGVLMLGGTLTATFLALSDARPDLATMAAVGARPRTRRAVAAGYALVVGAVGAVLGTPIGFIPGVAISKPLTRDGSGATVLEVPWLLITVVVVGLPLLTAAAVGLAARSRLPLAARID
ncbi:ABC transporter permease [Nocardioides sp. zg-536]|uniref:ABC transporter permease n=1 Tax=Nocardioides faecalis TaxID=2803858 RepID=A0A938Y4H8_9ACTN|nr:ABC transporter permease [Nocardioides faecalis]MBM9459858.1 ABC transporter permease [Nocardioides faecalis]QVI58904.1 ABC transporter permease [Nocardioides faecalis]